AHALAALAKEEVPDAVLRAYATDRFTFGREYLIPKPFDHRVLLNVPVAVARAAAETGVAQEPITDFDAYCRRLEKLLGRARGITVTDARRILNSRNYFAMMMVEEGDADGVIAGLHAYYPATVRPALQIIKTKPGVKNVSGAYLLMFKNQMLVLADTTVNIDPSAEELAEIAVQTAETARRFNLDPRVAMVSFSNFGSTKHPDSDKVQAAVRILHE